MEKEIKEEMGKNAEGKAAAVGKEKNITMAIIAYVVFFIPLLTEDKSDTFVRFHVRQGMILFVAWAAAAIANVVPVIGGMLGAILSFAAFVLTAVGIFGAYKGEQKPLPVIGKYADSIKI